MGRRRTISRGGVTITNRGSHETYNGIAWAAEVAVSGMRFRVENDGNGGCERWYRCDGAAHMFDGEHEAMAEIAALARTEPALAEYADIMSGDHEAAGMFISAALDGCFLSVRA